VNMDIDKSQTSDQSAAVAGPQDTKAKGATILFIEDDPLLLKMYKTKFENEGFQVLTAEDGEEGLLMASGHSISLMILDLMLPKLSGLDMLAKYRAEPNGKNVPVVVLTNLTHEEEIKRAKELGVKEFIVKTDFTPSEVVLKVKELLGK